MQTLIHTLFDSDKFRIASRYSLFALIAICVNLATQAFVFAVFGPDTNILFPLAAGTATGLVCKYVLDKKYIFAFETRGVADDGATFFVYAVVGVLTTVIFWGFEMGFNYFFTSEYAKYVGGAIGLTIGYVLKYQIDKRVVFVRRGEK